MWETNARNVHVVIFNRFSYYRHKWRKSSVSFWNGIWVQQGTRQEREHIKSSVPWHGDPEGKTDLAKICQANVSAFRLALPNAYLLWATTACQLLKVKDDNYTISFACYYNFPNSTPVLLANFKPSANFAFLFWYF